MKRVYLRRSQWSQPARFGVSLAVIICVFSVTMARLSSASVPRVPSTEERLRRHGFATETDEDVQAILHHSLDPYREMGLQLLVDRKGQGAIEILKEFLNDEGLSVRATAASLLGQLGDSSGLPVMRQEYESLIGPEENQRDAGALRKLSSISIGFGLEVGEVLVELGDYRGYPLALYTFDHRESDAVFLTGLKTRAIDVFAALGKEDPEQLASEQIDLRAAYDKAIDASDSWYLFRKILVTVDRGQIDPELAIYVTDRLVDTRRLPDWGEEYIRDKVKPRIEQRMQQSRANTGGKETRVAVLSIGVTSHPASQPTSQPAARPADAADSHSEKQPQSQPAPSQ